MQTKEAHEEAWLIRQRENADQLLRDLPEWARERLHEDLRELLRPIGE